MENLDAAHPAARATRREWLGLVALVLPGVVVTMDLTILHLAVPALTEDLQPSPSQLLWIVDVYGFLLAASLLTMGSVGDRIGRRRLLLVGAAAFAAASAVAAFATSAAMLVAARAALGVAAATLAPSTLALIRTMFQDTTERTTAIAVWGTAFAVGGALGPLVGGALLQTFWWGAVFLVPLPVMALLLALGPRLLPEYRAPSSMRLDLASAALSLASLLAIIYGVKRAAEDGLGLVQAGSVAAGVALGILFLRRQRGLAHPFIDLALFGERAFAATVLMLLLNALVMFASSFFNAQYMQLVLGLSPLATGLWILPSMATVTVSSMLSPQLLKRYRRDPLMVACLLLCAAGFGLAALVGVGGLSALVAGSVVMAMGAGPVGTLASEAILSAASHERAGSAAAIANASAELGGALGIAVLGSIGVAVYRTSMLGAAAPEAARESLAEAVTAARALPPDARDALLETSRDAFATAFVLVQLVSAGLMVLTAVMMRAPTGKLKQVRAVAVEP